MRNRKLKVLAAALALTMTVGAVPPVTGTEIPMITATVEAAAKKVSLKAYNKKVYAGRSGKIKVKSTRGAKLSYKTSNKKIATVNSRGVVTGKKAGTVKITITAKKSKYKTVKKTITVKVVKQNQKITASSQTLALGQRKNLGAKAKTGMTYKSSNPKVVTVDKKGNLKALKTGTAKITIYAKASGAYNKAFRTITVKVVKKAAAPKQTETVKPTAVPKQTETKAPETQPPQTETKAPETEPKQTETTKPAEPKQTEPDVPKETETEKPAEPPKETETTKPEEPKQTEPDIPKETETEKPDTSVSYVTSMYFEETAKTNVVYVGESKKSTLKWEATGNTTLKDFVFTSSNPAVATVDENGTITGVSAGDVRITATSKTPFSAAGTKDDCLTATYKYHIKVRTTEIDSIYYPSITGNEAITQKNIGIGETKDCTLKIETMGNGSISDVIFTTSDPSIATVDENGKVTGKKAGYVTITAKTKHPSEMDGQTILTDSTTYHVGDYTYEEILNGLTMDTVAGQAAHEVMNDLRQNPDHRNFFKDYPSYPTREWSDGLLRDAATRASRNIVCVMLGGWAEGEMSTINPLASHGGAFNGYGGSGWESTGEDLGKAASVFFEDIGHFGNETDSFNKYEAIAVVQYKNEAGVNLTSMIVQAAPGKNHDIENALQNTEMPHSQYYDICNHFGIPTTGTVEDSGSTQSITAGNLTEDIFTDGSTSTVDSTSPVETPDAGLQEETEETEEIELSPEEETDAAADVDVTFE